MLLADMGAEVITLDRVGARKNLKAVAVRGRKVVELDLKDKGAIAQVLDLLSHADALVEGFRPGVMERLGLGPDVVLARNPKLVYGRMTGWGRAGPPRRSTWSAISAAVRFISWSACSPRCWKRRNRARDRWSIPRCATARPR